MRVVTILVAAGLLASAVDAAAQTDESRFFLGVSGAFEPGTETYSDGSTFPKYDELGRVDVSSEVSSGAVLDFGVGARLTGNWIAAANFHRTSSADVADVSGQVPHPLFFDRPRSFSASVDDLKRTEQALHLSIGYRLGLTDKVDVQFLAGPSQFRFTQEVVSGVDITEVGGAFTAVNVAAQTQVRKHNAWGGHVGADISYQFAQSGTANFRLGAYIRYAEAASEFQVVSQNAKTKVGGTQFGLGLRVRF
ncbi:MAG: outer membrane beta-barrel protein [Vicinamibacterales bacterium]